MERVYGVRKRDVSVFTYQLASLTRAGVPILRALSLISEQTERRGFAQIVGELRDQIRDGKALSEAMSQYPSLFDTLYLSMVRSGERAGVLDEVLYRLAEYREREWELRQKVRNALTYPLLIISVGVVSVFVILTFFLPRVITLLEEMGQSLPRSTKILIEVSRFVSGHWLWFLIALGLILIAFGKGKPGSRKKWVMDAIRLHIPFVRRFTRAEEIVRFARTMSLLLKNGLHVYESLELAIDTLNNDLLKEELKEVSREIVEQGSTLSENLKEKGIFPNFVVNMLAVGEEGGRLEESLEEIAHSYEREVEQMIKMSTSLLEPLLILVVGVVVGFIVYALLLPIFNMNMGIAR